MNEFGKFLRKYRNHCTDPDNPDKKLTQERFGELIGRELGIKGGYSGAAVSDWERGESRIRADDRFVLICLLIVLQKHGGIGRVEEANQLLEAGGYRTLDTAEIEKVWPEKPETDDSQTQPQSHQSTVPISLENYLFISNEELRSLLVKAKEGPEPVWPRMLVTFLRYFSDHLTVFHGLKVIAWIWLWLIARWLLAPSLHWPFQSQPEALFVMKMYTLGTMVIPPSIGLLANPKNNAFWQQYNLATAPINYLYTQQGAFIGFHLGYFLAIVLFLK